MNQFSFVPIDTPCGRLSLTVSYLPALEDESSEPSTPLSTQFIMDYVGSRTIEPLKSFQSVPSAGPLPQFVSITRRHSWSNEHGGMPSGSPSPSPTYFDSQATHYNPNLHLPPRHLHDQSPSVAHKKNASFEDYLSSFPFSPMSSPSTPTHFPAGHFPNALLRSESAPVCIPLPRHGRNSGLLNQALPPTSPKPEKPASWTSSPEGKLQTKKEPLTWGDFEAGMSLAKALYFGNGEVGSLHGLKCSSPHIPFSRSSSRLSLLDAFDDSEFACPFADDEDITESCNRVELSEGKDQVSESLESRGVVPVQRSPDAAVGALVQMLKTAPPLQQDLSNSIRSSQVFRGEFWNLRIQHNESMEAEWQNLKALLQIQELQLQGYSSQGLRQMD
ncbi:putative Autophagy-related protein 13b [Cocos nucifera]|nr:putative Autophagy-related protein 13b [Cocos nucifera]